MLVRFPRSRQLIILLLMSAGGIAQGQALPTGAQSSQTLSLEEVVNMTKGRVAEDVIITRIKRNNKAFDLNSAEIMELQQLGVSEKVVKYLIDPSQPYGTAPPPPAAGPTAPPAVSSAVAAPVAPPPSPAKPPSDPLVLKLPPEMGVYWLDDHFQAMQVELKPVVTSKQAGKSKLLLGLKKGSNVGSLAGATAKVVLPVGQNSLYARIPTAVEDLVLVRVEPDDGRRDLDFGANPAKPTFPTKSVRPFEAKDVGQGVVRITLPVLDKGEYLLLILGSGDEKKGTLGKGWEFGVQ